jgi:hypothetical protein
MNGLTTGLNNMNARTQAWWGTVVAGWNRFWGQVYTTISTGISRAISGLVSGLNTMNARTQAWWSSVVAGWNSFWGNVASAISSGWARVTGFFTSTFSRLTGMWNSFWGGLAGVVNRAVSGVVDAVGRMMGPISNAIGRISEFLGSVGRAASAVFNPKGAASGMIVNGPRVLLTGEAGPEAIVPLRRPLSLVSPDVRALSAIAQGKSAPASAPVGASKTLNIQPGAIVIQGDRDPNRTALGVVNRLAERIAG